ncbi:MAG: aldo/keto reductase [Propionibacteriaceae bacterium]|jgi:aryl-alcohol dehydrogenase-like predicted oxidoreductase|nr:aldo/keto reductase [Propionibacteriaceae bacterium]
MRTRAVGATDLQVSRVGLGTMAWAQAPASTAVALLKRFWEAGGSLVDTAAAYGGGEVEDLLGRALGSLVPRDELVIATKSGFVQRDGRRVVDTSAKTLLDDLAGSLRRLGTDHVDLWQVHAWGQAPLEETLEAVDRAVASGQARYAGVSNYIGWQLAYAATWQRARGQTPLASVQVEYSLLARRAEIELLPCCAALGLGFFPWSSLGRGVLTGQYREGVPAGSRAASDAMAWFVEPYLDESSRGVVEGVARAASGLGLTPAQVALLWVRDAPGVTAPLVGPRTVEQLDELLQAEALDLPREIVEALDDVSGGPNALRPPVVVNEPSVRTRPPRPGRQFPQSS